MMKRIFAGSLALIIAGAAAPGTAWGQADQPAQVNAKIGQSIVVLAPRARENGKTYSGIPIETLSAQSVVYFDDLDLSTQAGREELGNRVEQAAETACGWIDEVYPLSTPIGPDDCARDAVKRAQDQVDAAIASAR